MRVFSQHESEDAVGLEIGPERLFKPFVMFVREHKTAIGNALNRSLVVALDVPAGDRFSEISERGDDELCIDPTVMEMERSANVMIVQVEFGAHRPASEKTKLMAEICRQPADAAGVAPDNVFIVVIPVSNESYSFGRGVAQWAGVAPRL